MELVPIIKTLLLYGSIFFTAVIVISFVLSKLKNNNKSELKEYDLVPNYINKPTAVKQNVKVIRRSEIIDDRRKTVVREKPTYIKPIDVNRKRKDEKRKLENPSIYYLDSKKNSTRTTRVNELRNGPTIEELKSETKARRFTVLNENIESNNPHTSYLENRFTKSFSYGR